MLPHAYAFVDPLFSTGIAWSLRAVERLSLLFESREPGTRVPSESELARYEAMVAREADQIDRIVAGAYEAGAHFDLFAAHAMIYFATVSFSEVRQRLEATGASHPAWSGFLGVGDQVLEPLALESLDRLRRITEGDGRFGTEEQRRDYEHWVRTAIEPRNIGGFGDPERHNLYPLDIDLLVERHEVLGMTRHALLDALPMLLGTATRDGQTPISSGR
jgi:FADH2 O2-dependent halogenase